MAVKINNDTCNGCGKCVAACPVEAITLNKSTNRAVIDEDQCTECGICVDECKRGALSLD